MTPNNASPYLILTTEHGEVRPRGSGTFSRVYTRVTFEKQIFIAGAVSLSASVEHKTLDYDLTNTGITMPQLS